VLPGRPKAKALSSGDQGTALREEETALRVAGAKAEAEERRRAAVIAIFIFKVIGIEIMNPKIHRWA